METVDIKSQSSSSAAERMGVEPIGKLLLKFSIPAIIGMLVNAVYNIVDRIYIGQGVDPLGIAGIGVVMPIMLIGGALGTLVGVGANALFAIRLGEGRVDEVEDIMGHAISLLCIMGTIAAAIGLIFMDPLLKGLMGVSDQIYPYAKSYLTVILCGTPFLCMGAGLTHFIRSDGHPKTSMSVQIVGAVTNIILDPILIFGFDMDLAGAALATIFSQFFTWLLVILYFNSSRTHLRFHFRKMIPRLPLTFKIISIGFSSFALNIAMSAVGIIQNKQIIRYGGDEALTAMTISFSVITVIIMSVMGIGMGAQPILGYNYGAKKYARVQRCFTLELIAGACILFLGFLIAELAPGFCYGLFSRDTGPLKDLTIRTLRIMVMMFPIVAFQLMGSQFFQAIGKPVQGTILGLSRQILFFIPCLYFLPILWESMGGRGINGVFYTFPISDLLSSILSFTFILREFRRWKKPADPEPALIIAEA